MEIFTSKYFKEKSFQNNLPKPWHTNDYAVFDCKRTVPLQSKEPSLCNHFCFSFPFNKCESSRLFCGDFAPITCQSHVPTGGWNFAGGWESALSIKHCALWIKHSAFSIVHCALSIMHYALWIKHCELCIKKNFLIPFKPVCFEHDVGNLLLFPRGEPLRMRIEEVFAHAAPTLVHTQQSQ